MAKSEFEYKVERIRHDSRLEDTEAQLNECGFYGWELVTVVDQLGSEYTLYYFKRLIKKGK